MTNLEIIANTKEITAYCATIIEIQLTDQKKKLWNHDVLVNISSNISFTGNASILTASGIAVFSLTFKESGKAQLLFAADGLNKSIILEISPLEFQIDVESNIV